jgi:hypothetical protein
MNTTILLILLILVIAGISYVSGVYMGIYINKNYGAGNSKVLNEHIKPKTK